MSVQREVLEAALRICGERRTWTFTPREIVRALPHLKASSVRTHVVSRCCVNAPKHHLHRWKYFRRIGRGTYEVVPAMRRLSSRSASRPEPRVAEAAAGAFRRRVPGRPRQTIHAVVTLDGDLYVVECLELAVVTQGHTLDEVVAYLREAIGLHLEGETPREVGVVEHPRISLTYELTV